MLTKLNQILVVTMMVTGLSFAQERQSPPAKVSTSVNGAEITINYSQPSVKGRQIWGELVPYGQVWRTGANEATVFETTKDLEVQGKTLKAGKYSFFTIPGENEWTIIFNSTLGQWGAYKYDKAADVLRVSAKPTTSDFVEKFTISANEGDISMAWDKIAVTFSVK